MGGDLLTRNHAAEAPSEDEAAFLAALGKRVREMRERHGLVRKALAREADVSERYLGQLEAGEGNVSVLLLRRIAAALNASCGELLANDEQQTVERRLIRRFLDRLPPRRMEDVIFRLMREFGHEESVRRNRIALIGLRGAGKSTLGSLLARDMQVPFVELNREIECDTGLPVAEVFALYGQAGYRRMERRALERAIKAHDRMVLSAGGGVVAEDDTFNLLLTHCYTVCLQARPEEHMSRVLAQGDFRPMAESEEAMADLKRILAAREPLYRKADSLLDTSGQTPEQSLAALRRLLTV